MTKEKKLTKAERFALMLNYAEVKANPEMVEFINHEIELLTKKNKGGERKLTPTQKENLRIANALYDEMAENRWYTIGELMKECSAFAGISSNQKACSIVRVCLLDVGRVERSEVKGKALFRKVLGVAEPSEDDIAEVEGD